MWGSNRTTWPIAFGREASEQSVSRQARANASLERNSPASGSSGFILGRRSCGHEGNLETDRGAEPARSRKRPKKTAASAEKQRSPERYGFRAETRHAKVSPPPANLRAHESRATSRGCGSVASKTSNDASRAKHCKPTTGTHQRTRRSLSRHARSAFGRVRQSTAKILGPSPRVRSHTSPPTTAVPSSLRRTKGRLFLYSFFGQITSSRG